MSASKRGKCWRCLGDGHFWRVPDGFNPFSAGGWATARASWRVECFYCDGTGEYRRPPNGEPVAQSASVHQTGEKP